LETSKIDENWLVCPIGEPDRAIPMTKFAADLKLMECREEGVVKALMVSPGSLSGYLAVVGIAMFATAFVLTLFADAINPLSPLSDPVVSRNSITSEIPKDQSVGDV
jgi:hypothetical protein